MTAIPRTPTPASPAQRKALAYRAYRASRLLRLDNGALRTRLEPGTAWELNEVLQEVFDVLMLDYERGER